MKKESAKTVLLKIMCYSGEIRVRMANELLGSPRTITHAIEFLASKKLVKKYNRVVKKRPQERKKNSRAMSEALDLLVRQGLLDMEERKTLVVNDSDLCKQQRPKIYHTIYVNKTKPLIQMLSQLYPNALRDFEYSRALTQRTGSGDIKRRLAISTTCMALYKIGVPLITSDKPNLLDCADISLSAYTSVEIKTATNKEKSEMQTRFTAVMFTAEDYYSIYNLMDGFMQWSETVEQSSVTLIRSLLKDKGRIFAPDYLDKAILMGDKIEIISTLLRDESQVNSNIVNQSTYDTYYFVPNTKNGLAQLCLFKIDGYKDLLMSYLYPSYAPALAHASDYIIDETTYAVYGYDLNLTKLYGLVATYKESVLAQKPITLKIYCFDWQQQIFIDVGFPASFIDTTISDTFVYMFYGIDYNYLLANKSTTYLINEKKHFFDILNCCRKELVLDTSYWHFMNKLENKEDKQESTKEEPTDNSKKKEPEEKLTKGKSLGTIHIIDEDVFGFFGTDKEHIVNPINHLLTDDYFKDKACHIVPNNRNGEQQLLLMRIPNYREEYLSRYTPNYSPEERYKYTDNETSIPVDKINQYGITFFLCDLDLYRVNNFMRILERRTSLSPNNVSLICFEWQKPFLIKLGIPKEYLTRDNTENLDKLMSSYQQTESVGKDERF